MRFIMLAMLTVLVLAPQAADAARREDRTAQTASRQTASRHVTTRPAAAPRSTARGAAQQTARTTSRAASRQATRTASRQVAGRGRATQAGRASDHHASSNRQASLRRGDVRSQRRGLVVRGAAAATISRADAVGSASGRSHGRAAAGWQAGLPAMSMAQQDCPVGTFATLARGHDDVIRCMPL